MVFLGFSQKMLLSLLGFSQWQVEVTGNSTNATNANAQPAETDEGGGGGAALPWEDFFHGKTTGNVWENHRNTGKP